MPRALEETDFCGDAFAERIGLVEVVAVQTQPGIVGITLILGAEQMIPDREIIGEILVVMFQHPGVMDEVVAR